MDPALVEVRVRDSVTDDAASTLVRQHPVRARLVSCRPSANLPSARLLRWIDLHGAPEELQRLEAALRRSPAGDGLSVSAVSGDRAIIRLSGPMPEFCSAVFSSGGACATCPMLETPPGEGGSPSARVLVPRNGDAARFGRELSRQHLGRASIERTGPYRARSTLTSRQEEALAAALELGYFEYPRRSDLSAVARRLGVGRSAALELLRRAVSGLAHLHYASPGDTAERF